MPERRWMEDATGQKPAACHGTLPFRVDGGPWRCGVCGKDVPRVYEEVMPVEVTEEMVERALQGWEDADPLGKTLGPWNQLDRDCMRAALTAALEVKADA